MTGRRGESGSALLTSLLLMLLLHVVVLAVVTRVLGDVEAVRRQEREVRALAAAEAGLAELLQRVRHDLVVGAGSSGELAGATWEARLGHGAHVGGWDAVELTSVGDATGVRRGVRLVAWRRDVPGRGVTLLRVGTWTALGPTEMP